MEKWLGIGEALLLVVACLILPLVVLAARRRWLARLGGTFECSLRLHSTRPGGGWSLGVARYNDDLLEWFRFFSFALRPRVAFPRREVKILESREPNPVEAVALYADQLVVRLEDADGHEWQLAMSPGSLTGLLSWLESSPPGLVRPG